MVQKHINKVMICLILIQILLVVFMKNTENTLYNLKDEIYAIPPQIYDELERSNEFVEEFDEEFYKKLIKRAVEGEIGIYNYIINDDITLYSYSYPEWEYFKYFYSNENSEREYVEYSTKYKLSKFYVHDIYDTGEKYIILGNLWFLYDAEKDKLVDYNSTGGFRISLGDGTVYSGRQHSLEDTVTLTYYNSGNQVLEINLINHHDMINGGDRYYKINNIEISEEQFKLFLEQFEDMVSNVPFYSREDIWGYNGG